MKSSYLLAGVGVVAVIGIVGWLTLGSGPKDATEIASQTYVDESAGLSPVADPETLSGQDTFAHLLKLGRSLECSFQFKDSQVGSEGTGFFDGKNMRVDSMYSETGGPVFTSNMISDGTTMYVWSNTASGQFAMKLAVPAESTTPTPVKAPEQKSGQLNMEDNVHYTCKPWKVDGSVFVPPADITFMDMNDLMKKVPAGMMTR